jgi:hypothetical protein
LRRREPLDRDGTAKCGDDAASACIGRGDSDDPKAAGMRRTTITKT